MRAIFLTAHVQQQHHLQEESVFIVVVSVNLLFLVPLQSEVRLPLPPLPGFNGLIKGRACFVPSFRVPSSVQRFPNWRDEPFNPR